MFTSELIDGYMWYVIGGAILNLGFAVSNREIFFPVQCVVTNNNIHIFLTYIASFFISFSLSMISLIVAYCLANIVHYNSGDVKYYWIHLWLANSILWGPLLFRCLYIYINKKGIKIIDKFVSLKIGKDANNNNNNESK